MCGYAGRGGSTAKSVPLMARMLRREASSRDGGPGGHVLFTSRLRRYALCEVSRRGLMLQSYACKICHMTLAQ